MSSIIFKGNHTFFHSRNQKKIRFYDTDHLLKYTFSTGRRSRDLCASSPSTLVYVTHSMKKRDVTWLDLSRYPPDQIEIGPFNGKAAVCEFCIAMHGGKQLFITSNYAQGIRFYDTHTKKLLCLVQRKLPGMSKRFNAQGITVREDNGLLYVCDQVSTCVHAFSLDGRYLETPVKFNSKNRPSRMLICWCEELKSVVVCNAYPDHLEVHVVKLD